MVAHYDKYIQCKYTYYICNSHINKESTTWNDGNHEKKDKNESCVLPGGHGSAGETEAAVCRAASRPREDHHKVYFPAFLLSIVDV